METSSQDKTLTHLKNSLNSILLWCVQTRGIHWRDHIYQAIYSDLEAKISDQSSIDSVMSKCKDILDERSDFLDEESIKFTKKEQYN